MPSIVRQDPSGVKWEDREKAVEEVLPEVPDRYKFLKFVEGIAEGHKTRDLLKELSMRWPDFVKLYNRNRALYDLYVESKKLGEEYRQAIREDEADRRAVEGTLKPVFHKGEICGYVREYSDQMLALQLKAGNPDKYAERKQVDVKGVMLNLNIEGVERAPRKVDKD